MRRQLVLFAFVFFFAGLTARAQSPDPAGSPQQANPPACTGANCPQAPVKPVAANPDAPSKPAAKPHRVFTNEDFDAQPHEVIVQGGRELLHSLNECDRTCFDQVAQRAGNGGYGSARWKLGLLDAVDAVKADSVWQGILGEILGVKAQACELQVKKTQDLQRFSDPRTVTPSELAVEREYEPKFREIQVRLNAILNRANAHIAKSSEHVLQSAFMQLQIDKLSNATCRINVPRSPEDTDDPDDP
ncbi:MAG TPA: hypothetical protein VE263_01145 [Candidatus Angelobacter sp.]|nr:hypothetical protein [Candidatus Angelobacter sp.]